jgi:hypothetical protein
MPGVSKAAQAFVAARCLEDSLHALIMTIISCLGNIVDTIEFRGNHDVRRDASRGLRPI